jgi:Raf kinase inhibitor-like YbhB/YbcL family protein
MATKMTHPQADIALTSPAFGFGERIPTEYTADGRDASPPLKWDGVPAGARGLALICEDPDATRGTFAHWVAFNLPPDTRELGEGVPAKESLPGGAAQGANGFGRPGYGGPSPPAGKPHRYVFHLHALDEKLDLPAGVTREQLASAMKGHILGQGELTGTYGRPASG